MACGSQMLRPSNMILCFMTGAIFFPSTERNSGHSVTITAQSLLKTPQDFERIVLRADTDGGMVLLRDVARVELGAENYEIQAYYDNLLATQKDSYTTTPADYGSAAEDFQMNGGDPMTVEEPSSCGGDCSGCSGCH